MFYLYFFLIIAIIGSSVLLEYNSAKERAKGQANQRSTGTRGDASVSRRDVSDRATEQEDLESARNFVEQLKRQRSSEQNQRDSLRDETPIFEQTHEQVYEPISPKRKVGKNYVERASLRKSFRQLERENAAIQARIRQTELDIAKINALHRQTENQQEKEQEVIGQTSLKSFLRDKSSLSRAFVVSEILSKPVSLRK